MIVCKLRTYIVHLKRADHNAFEFLLDFGQFYPESTERRFHTRIVTGPVYVKTLSDSYKSPSLNMNRPLGLFSKKRKREIIFCLNLKKFEETRTVLDP
jgi:hypothetical protein